MISKTTIKKLENQGHTMGEIQACWKEMEKDGMNLLEFGKMMKVRADNP